MIPKNRYQLVIRTGYLYLHTCWCFRGFCMPSLSLATEDLDCWLHKYFVRIPTHVFSIDGVLKELNLRVISSSVYIGLVIISITKPTGPAVILSPL